jgi:hypothetical protein
MRPLNNNLGSTLERHTRNSQLLYSILNFKPILPPDRHFSSPFTFLVLGVMKVMPKSPFWKDRRQGKSCRYRRAFDIAACYTSVFHCLMYCGERRKKSRCRQTRYWFRKERKHEFTAITLFPTWFSTIPPRSVFSHMHTNFWTHVQPCASVGHFAFAQKRLLLKDGIKSKMETPFELWKGKCIVSARKSFLRNIIWCWEQRDN